MPAAASLVIQHLSSKLGLPREVPVLVYMCPYQWAATA